MPISAPLLPRHCLTALLLLVSAAACRDASSRRAPAPRRVGQWIWTRADLARFDESRRELPTLEAGVLIGAVRCDATSGALSASAALTPTITAKSTVTVTAVIRFEDGLDRCRDAADQSERFNQSLDSVVRVLRARGGAPALRAVQLDYDAPQRALAAWAGSVRFLRAHALRTDSVWVTSIIAHLREPTYGALFRDVVRGHVLQVFDTGEPASEAHVQEAVRLVARADMPFRLGLGAFERETRRGRTDHRAWFATVPQFVAVTGYCGLWIFPAGRRWIFMLKETG